MAADKIFCPSCGKANAIGSKFCLECGGKIPTLEKAKDNPKRSDFITLACPNCGGKLQVGVDMQRFTCQHCGLEHLVRHEGGAISLSPVLEGLKRVEGKFDQVLTGSDRMAAEQTIQRLKNEMPAYEQGVIAKKAQLTAAASLAGKRILQILLYIFVIAAGLLLIAMVGVSFVEFYWYEPGFIISVFVVSALFILGILWLRKLSKRKYSKRRQNRIETIQAELDQLEDNLQKRRNQLEQLHRYTAER